MQSLSSVVCTGWVFSLGVLLKMRRKKKICKRSSFPSFDFRVVDDKSHVIRFAHVVIQGFCLTGEQYPLVFGTYQ